MKLLHSVRLTVPREGKMFYAYVTLFWHNEENNRRNGFRGERYTEQTISLFPSVNFGCIFCLFVAFSAYRKVHCVSQSIIKPFSLFSMF